MPTDVGDRHQFDPKLVNYFAQPGPHCLEIGRLEQQARLVGN